MRDQGLSVYVADDHRYYRDAFVQAVGRVPNTTVAGSSACGHDALRDLVAAPPDVAILGHGLPGLGGIDIAQALDDAGLPTRVVVVTSLADSSAVDRALDAGASAVVAREDVVRHLPSLLEGVRRGATVVRDRVDAPPARRPPRPRAAATLDEVHQREGTRRVAALRVGCGLAVALLAVARPSSLESGFWLVYAAMVAWMVATTFVLLRPLSARAVTAIGVLDGVAMFALIEASGDADSAIRFLLLLGPLCYAPFVAPRVLVGLAAVGATAYLAAVVGDELDAQTRESTGQWVLLFAFLAIFAVMTARVSERRLTDLRRLSDGRQRLLGQLLGTEFRERRRLSQELHDEALQLLLAARQDLEEAAVSGDRASLALAQSSLTEGIRRLRETVHDLHPIALDHGGLDLALHAICDRQARLGGFVAQIAVTPEAAGIHDELLVSLARELVTNAAKHAQAERLHVTVRVEGPDLTMAVVDDGRGFPPGRREDALADGHIGLASCVERVEAAGGRIAIDSQVGGGTAVRISVPVDLEVDVRAAA